MIKIKKGSIHKKIYLPTGNVQPYVLENSLKIVTKKSALRFFGQSEKSNWLAEFVLSFSRYGIVSNQLADDVTGPILFSNLNLEDFPIPEEAYRIETFIEICKLIVSANDRGFLSVLELKFARLAQSVLDANLESPFDWQIDELTGINLEKSKAKRFLIDYLNAHNENPAYEWILTFPDSALGQIFERFGVDWSNVSEQPLDVAGFIDDTIFRRLDDKLLNHLKTVRPKREYRRKKGPQQNQNPLLTQHMELVSGLMSISGANDTILAQLLEKARPLNANRTRLNLKEPPSSTPIETDFDKRLQKALESKKVKP